MTQSDVDLLIFSATMTKKCFPKCVRNLPGHGMFPHKFACNCTGFLTRSRRFTRYKREAVHAPVRKRLLRG